MRPSSSAAVIMAKQMRSFTLQRACVCVCMCVCMCVCACVCVRVCVLLCCSDYARQMQTLALQCLYVFACEDGSIQQVILWKFDRRRNTQTLNKEQNNHVSVLCYCAYIKEQRLHALER